MIFSHMRLLLIFHVPSLAAGMTVLLSFTLARHLGKDAEIHNTGTTVVIKYMTQALSVLLVFGNAQRFHDINTWLKLVGNQVLF